MKHRWSDYSIQMAEPLPAFGAVAQTVRICHDCGVICDLAYVQQHMTADTNDCPGKHKPPRGGQGE